MINHIGESISKELNISPPAGRGLFKLAIKDELGPFTENWDIGLENFMKVIKNSLKLRFEQLKIENYTRITELLRKELIKSQSLLTIGSI